MSVDLATLHAMLYKKRNSSNPAASKLDSEKPATKESIIQNIFQFRSSGQSEDDKTLHYLKNLAQIYAIVNPQLSMFYSLKARELSVDLKRTIPSKDPNSCPHCHTHAPCHQKVTIKRRTKLRKLTNKQGKKLKARARLSKIFDCQLCGHRSLLHHIRREATRPSVMAEGNQAVVTTPVMMKKNASQGSAGGRVGQKSDKKMKNAFTKSMDMIRVDELKRNAGSGFRVLK